MGLEFPRSARLTESGAFHKVRKEGRSWPSRYMMIGVLAHSDSEAPARFGVITSKRVGNAVVRNKTRRRFREIIRHHRNKISPGFWVVIIARTAASQTDYRTLEDELLRLFKRASILHSAS